MVAILIYNYLDTKDEEQELLEQEIAGLKQQVDVKDKLMQQQKTRD